MHVERKSERKSRSERKGLHTEPTSSGMRQTGGIATEMLVEGTNFN